MKITIQAWKGYKENRNYYYIYLTANNGGYMNDAIARVLNISRKDWQELLEKVECTNRDNKPNRNLSFKEVAQAEAFIELLEPYLVMKTLTENNGE